MRVVTAVTDRNVYTVSFIERPKLPVVTELPVLSAEDHRLVLDELCVQCESDHPASISDAFSCSAIGAARWRSCESKSVSHPLTLVIQNGVVRRFSESVPQVMHPIG